MRVLDSARKWGVDDADMRHAVEVPLRIIDLDEDDLTLFIGGGLDGTLLEIVVADLDGDDPRIIHAMPLRRRFYDFLAKG